MSRRHSATLAILALAVLAADAAAQGEGQPFDEHEVALTWHKVTQETLDLAAAAQRSDAVMRASGFDRPDALKAEVARLQAQLDGASADRDFVIRVNDHVSEYDHQQAEFSVNLFSPGHYVPFQAFGQQYLLIFANAEAARPIALPKEEARELDARLVRLGRSITNEIRFRVIGKGDPTGSVSGQRVVRAELVAVRLLDRDGRVLWTPTVTPAAAAAAQPSAPFDVGRMDVAGFRVGVKADDLEATLARLFGPAERKGPGQRAAPGISGTIVVNDLGCRSMIGSRRSVSPGDVCVTALYDDDEVVRSIRVERVFSWFDVAVLRRALIQKYGATSFARTAGHFLLGWGPQIAPELAYRADALQALIATYETDEDFMTRGGNALPRIRVVLQLVDAEWAAKRSN